MKRKTTKIAGILLTLVMLVTMLGAFSLMASAADGDACTSTADCTGTYANGFCTVCDGYEQPTLNSDGYYEIDNAGKLYWFAGLVNGTLDGVAQNASANAILTKDIVVNEGTMTAETTGARAWTPIGNSSNRYSGTFDGNGKTVSGLYFNDQGEDYVGLFGYVGTNGKVQNVGVIDSYFRGYGNVGGVVGRNYGTVANCFNSSDLMGYNLSVGGVVGRNDGTVANCYNSGSVTGGNDTSWLGGVAGCNNGTVTGCYNTGAVHGQKDVGGVVGENSGTVQNCYNLGEVGGYASVGGVVGDNQSTVINCYNASNVIAKSNGNASAIAGGVVGINPGGTVTNSYYNNNMFEDGAIGKYGTSENVEGKTTTQFESGEVAYLLGDAFSQTIGTNATPVFATEANKVYQSFECDGTTPRYTNDASLEGKAAPHTFGANSNGFCTVCDGYEPAALVTEENYTELGLSADYIGYYAITNAGNLYWFADKVDNDNANFGSANAVLTADIKIPSKPSGTRHWNPIGSADAKYSGIFDGNGKAIGDIFAGDTTADMVGLVAWLTEDGVVKNVTVTGVRLNGNDTVGAIVAYNEGTVELCGNTASVIGEGVSIGGIVGVNLGTVRNCWNTGRINGKDAGGIVGDNESGAKLENCWYTGKLDGTNVGGIVANNKAGATVENCYTTRETAIATAEGTASKVETKTADQFASGEVAYLLGGVWGQNIDNGETPQTVPALNGADVYYGYFNCHSTEAKYTNTAVSAEPVEHSYDNGFCTNELTDGTVCDAYEPAVLVTEDNYTELGLSADYVGYYAIGNAGQLYWFADKVDNENATYGSVNVVLTKDITVNEGTVTASSTGMRDWNPIGWFTDTSDDQAAFSGTFDGNGKSISGLYFNNKDINGVSLFAITRETALVKNVTVTNSYFCGYGNNSAVVAINYGTVSGCFNEATLIGYAQIGGIVGRNLGLVELCGNTGAITGDWGNVGGIVGDNKSTVRNCWNTGSIQADLNYVGGITGANNSVATDGTAALTENCWSTGTVVSFGRTTAGGIVGAAWVNLGGVRNCYSLMKPVGGTWNGHPVTNVETKTAEQFASGEVAYLLGAAWGQTLGANGDAYPVFATDTNKVYMYKTGLCSAIEYKYTNVETADSLTHDAGDTAAERFDSATGACSACGELMAVASLTTADATPVVTYYMTLENAIAAAQSAKGSTVMLLDDVKLSTSLSIPADCVLILDLNGKTISNAEDVSFSRMIDVYGELTIGDSSANKDGKIVLSSGDSTSATVFTCNTLTVNNGTIANTAGGFAIKAAIIGMALPGTSAPVGFLVVENGVFVGGVTVWNENFSIRGGDFELLAIYDRAPDASMLGERLTGGSFDRIVNGEPEEFTLADCLAKDVYAYGSDGKVISLAGATELTNVTVKQGADLSKDAVITVSNSEYNGAAQTPTVIVTVGGVQLEYGVDYTVTVDGGAEARNAGEYPITVTGIGNYTGSANKTFTIEKATPKADDFSGAIPNDPTYDGTAKTAIIEAKSGIVGMGAITVKYYDANGSQLTGAPINAGTYTVKIDVAEGDNYEAVTDLEIGSFTIAKATPVVTAPTAIEDLIYNGAVQAIATPGSTTGGTLQYAVYRGVYDGVGVPEGVWEEIIRTGPDSETETKAGTYSVLYRVVGDDNYESVAMQYFTVTVGKAMPTLNVTSPTPSVLPDNTILLSYTLTGVNGEELTNTVAIINAKVGDLVCDINGLKVTVPATAVIGGEDKLVVTLRSLADGNYDDSEVFTLTLEVGMADFTGAIAEVEADIDELNELIANKADAATVNQKMNELLSKIEALEEVKDDYKDADATLKSELESAIATAKQQAIDAASSALDTAKAELNEAIADGDTALDEKITNLNAALESAKAALEATDAANKTELEGKITSAQTSLQAAIDQVQTNLDSAKAELDKAIADLDAAMKQGDADLSTEIANLNTALTNAKAALEKADADNKAELVSKIEDADATLDAAIKAVQKNLDDAKAELDKAIADGDTALDEKITNLNAALESAKAALEATDAANKTELEGKITSAQTSLQAAIDQVQTNLDSAKAELDKAIADLDAAMKQGDADLSTEIANLNTALTNAKAALEKADADNKAELVSKIEDADATLDAAIKAVQKNLEDAQKALNEAIASGDTALDGKITDLNTALETAKAALEATDAANKTELEGKITSAQTSLQAAIDQVQTNLDSAKAELDKAIADLDAAMKQGDADLSTEIANLNTALMNAKAALEKADADNKAELVSKIETADATLDAAIKAVQKNLEEAQKALNKAIADGDTALDERITDLNTALETAKAALEATDAANKSELEGKITEAQTTLQSAIDKVAKDLADAEKELADAIASGDAALSSRISSVSASLSAAKTALEKADADNKAELIAKIEAAESTLDAAIKAVQKNLDDAKTALEKALSDGDKANADALAQAISDLNAAIDAAETAAATADGSLKTELTSKIDNADMALQAAIDALSTELDATNEKVGQLETFIIIVCVISGVALCGSGAFVVWFFIDKKKI